jgi:hypothetical protein
VQITEKQFRAFVAVRNGGQTNMWDATMVNVLSGGIVTSDAHIEIIKNFDQLSKQFPGIA